MTSHLRAVEVRKWERRQRRADHVRRSVFGTAERPRLAVHRSNKHFHAQIIDDLAGRTLAAASTEQEGVLAGMKHGGNKKAAELVGVKLAAVAKAKGISKVVFDRSFYGFHGRVRAFAEAAAKGGLDFLMNPKKKGKAPKVKTKAEKPAAKPEKKEKGQGKPPGAGGPKPPKQEQPKAKEGTS
jgi:large subunit ribosomal protein L18